MIFRPKKLKFGRDHFLLYGPEHGWCDSDPGSQNLWVVPQILPMCIGSQKFKLPLTWRFRNGITLGVLLKKAIEMACQSFFFKISEFLLWEPRMRPGSRIRLNQGVFWQSDPPKGYFSHTYDCWDGNLSKNKEKKFWPPPDLVTLLWNDPLFILHTTVHIHIDEICLVWLVSDIIS